MTHADLAVAIDVSPYLPMAITAATRRLPAAPTARPRRSSAADERAARALRAVNLAMALREARTKGTPPAPLVAEAEGQLARRLRAHLPRGTCEVVFTDNRYTMISVRRVPRELRYELRLHHMFDDVDPVIVRALARYAADNDRDASRVLGDFIDENQRAVRGRARRAPREILVTAGDVHDLRDIYDDLNRRYFDGVIDASITWGPRLGPPRRRDSIKLGSYAVEDRLIRLHRALDRADVPRYVVEWIVFHEMLHQVHAIERKHGRREYHSAAFLAEEARFEHYARAKAWERANLEALLEV